MRSGPLHVDEVGGPNWAAAIALLQEGQYVVFRNVGLTLVADVGKKGEKTLGPLVARIQSDWQLPHLTRKRALTSIQRGEAVVQGLIAESVDLRELVQDRGLHYELIDDYGTGSTLIATKVGGRLDWLLSSLKNDPPPEQNRITG